MYNITDEEYEDLIGKAKKFDEIEAKITSFYYLDEEQLENEFDLYDIGEYIASYFGWI